MKKALTIAASDSGGACGIQADLKTFSALGVFGTSVITAITAQNTVEMGEVQELSTEMGVEQTRMMLEDIKPEAVKLGMIGHAENYSALAEILGEFRIASIVVDPVITCYRGCPWVLGQSAIQRMKMDILPMTRVFAPSIPDAEIMLECGIRTVSEMEDAARELQALGPQWVVLKGGHLEEEPVDILWDGRTLTHLHGNRVSSDDDNGSGCVFSSAIAAYLALGHDPEPAVRKAKSFIEEALRHSVKVGQGKGTVNPFHATGATPHAGDVQGKR
jgi:hydroxymethylpyrimidine/phosphomethylpyrimidine kinase